MPVQSEHPEYTANVSKWNLVRDVLKSEVKKYIKDVDSSDPSRSARYKDDAQLTNFTSRTKNGLIGAIFRREPLIQLPSEVAYLNIDATGANESLAKVSQEGSGEVVTTGRIGILTDFPMIESGTLTAKEVEDLDIKPRLSFYTAESMINWKESFVNGKLMLIMLILKEERDEINEQDGFLWEQKICYRVLRMIDGIYAQFIYDEVGDLISENIPLDASGNPWDKIPFEFAGSENNDAVVDPSPIHDLARLNIGHLRNSADYEESVHITGQPTLIISTEFSKEDFEAANPNGIQIGARKGHNLGPGGSAQFLQATPNQLADVAMQRKEQQAIMIGAKIITPQATNETAEAARMRHSGETSILSVIAKNIEKALINSVMHVIRFTIPNFESFKKEDIIIELNDQFFDANLDPNMIMAQMQLARSGIITKTDIRNTLRKFGHLQDNRTDEDIEADPAKLIDLESNSNGLSRSDDQETEAVPPT